MSLPHTPPVLPMLAKRVDAVPTGDGWSFEPKWDGFRALIFRDGDEIVLQSRDTKPLNRYFPDLLEPLRAQLPERCILDGEIVIARDGALDFDALSLRIHPAASRVATLARETPAGFVAFDLLAVGDRDLAGEPFATRRGELEAMLARATPPLHLTPVTRDRALAEDWFRRFEGAGLDGVVAKALAEPYQPNKRSMLKIKHERDCDCVVAGFRWHKDGDGSLVGSLLLGLYNSSDALQHIGTCASFTAAKRRELVEFLAPYREGALAGHPWAHWNEQNLPGGDTGGQRMPGGKSRWTGAKDLSWEPLRPELVVEVAYEHMQGDRFRHMAQFRRWRSDKAPRECTYAQLETVIPHELQGIFRGQ